jgi:hypothetical protein
VKTLDDAWQWYLDTRSTLLRMERLGRKYWDFLPWQSTPLGRDNIFCVLESPQVTGPAQNARRPLDDLAIIVLFSVFEANVWGWSVEETADRLMYESGKAQKNGVGYALPTARRAAEAVEGRGRVR